MTSFAFIAGLIPLCMATGAGALGNRSIGTAAAGGMLTGTLFGLVIVPGLYVFFAKLAERFQTNPPTDDEPQGHYTRETEIDIIEISTQTHINGKVIPK